MTGSLFTFAMNTFASLTFNYNFRFFQIISIICLAALITGHLSAVPNECIDVAEGEVSDFKELLHKFYLEGVSCIMNSLLSSIEKSHATDYNFIRKLVNDSNTYCVKNELVNDFDKLVESHQCLVADYEHAATNKSQSPSDLVPEQENESNVEKIRDMTVEEEEGEEESSNKSFQKPDVAIAEELRSYDANRLSLLDLIRIFFEAIYYSFKHCYCMSCIFDY